ncbi:MAG: FAD-dependent oxidoreductase [Flavonifractor plautii]
MTSTCGLTLWITPENLTSFGADGVIFATGSLPSCPPVPGIGHAHKAMDMYDGNVKPGHKIVMVGGGLVGCEAGLFLQKTGHEVTVVELLGRLANESFGMYREALIWEMEKCGMAMLPKTRCLEIHPHRREGGERRRRPDLRPTPSSLPWA